MPEIYQKKQNISQNKDVKSSTIRNLQKKILNKFYKMLKKMTLLLNVPLQLIQMCCFYGVIRKELILLIPVFRIGILNLWREQKSIL
jgi:hypothetical protein